MFNMFTNNLTGNGMVQEEGCVLMSPPQLADYLGIGRNLAYQLLNEGTITGFKIGNQWKVSKQAVDLYIAKKSNLV
jgi:excisionase family DNA binding protein